MYVCNRMLRINLFTVLALLCSAFSWFCSAGDSIDVRFGAQPKGFRIVLESRQPLTPVTYQGNQDKDVLIHINNGAPITLPSTRPAYVRSAEQQKVNGTKRQLILSLNGPMAIKNKFRIAPNPTYKNHRYVIDFQENVAKPHTLKLSSPPPTQKSLPTPLPPPQKKIIIIDAGHGGADPGTIGRGGTYEKNVTLRAAKILADVLKKTNRYDVRLTRSTDVFIPLAKRVRFSRENQGNLFISLHADSSPRGSAQGLSVYTLSRVASDKEAAKLAQKENKADLFMGIDFDSEIPEVANILIDLTKRETMNLSISCAQMIQNAIDKKYLLSSNNHRFANFAVLRTPDIPAVLVELGFLSNPEDEKKLNSDFYLRIIASKLVSAIDLFFMDKKAL